MHSKTICRNLQIYRTMILKTTSKYKFLKILWFHPNGSSKKENEGECFAPWQRIISYLWFCAAVQQKIDFECQPELEFKCFWPRMKIFKNLISTCLLWDKRLSEGTRGLGDCSADFKVYLKMHLKVICRSLQIHRTVIPKTSEKHKFLKILWCSPKGSSEKKNEGECFAPCQGIFLSLI